jgi:hypothetical protein
MHINTILTYLSTIFHHPSYISTILHHPTYMMVTSSFNIHDGHTSTLHHYHYTTTCITLDRQRATYTQSDQVLMFVGIDAIVAYLCMNRQLLNSFHSIITIYYRLSSYIYYNHHHLCTMTIIIIIIYKSGASAVTRPTLRR